MFLILLAACGVEKEALDSPVEEVVDYRLTDLPEAPAGGLTLWGPEVEIEPYSDKMFCYYVDYPGDDAGIHSYDVYQGPVGHHMVLFRSTAGQADGSLEDCTDLSGQTMTMVEPILFAPTFGPGENLLTFPEGMGAAVRSGDKLMIQAHYLNTSDKPALVKDAINLGLIPEADVTTWTAPFAFTRTELTVPTGLSELSFDCPMEDDVQVMFLYGHMHETGKHFKFERLGDAENELLYEVDPWSKEYRDTPPVNDYMADPLEFKAGESFRTYCQWDNSTGEPISFPSEMCASSGMVYPSKVPHICSE